MSAGISRRDILKNLAIGAAGGSVLEVIPAEAAEYIHQLVRTEKGTAASAKYAPKYFSAHQYATLIFLCDAIIPKDEHSGGAVEGGAPEFIDLLTSENEKFHLIAYRANAVTNPAVSQGVTFFVLLRNMTCDAFYTSKIGIADLQYIGNTSLREFPGCPPLPPES